MLFFYRIPLLDYITLDFMFEKLLLRRRSLHLIEAERIVFAVLKNLVVLRPFILGHLSFFLVLLFYKNIIDFFRCLLRLVSPLNIVSLPANHCFCTLFYSFSNVAFIMLNLLPIQTVKCRAEFASQ